MSSTSTTYTPVSIDASTLAAYYTARAGAAGAASTGAAKAAGAAPTAPWSKGVGAATLNAAAKRVLDGGRFVDPGAAKLDAATSNGDYKNLFALFQGLTALEGLAQSAQSTTLSAADRLRLQSKFAEGLAQVKGFVAGSPSPFKTITVTPGAAAASVTTTSGVKADGAYVTGPIAVGDTAGAPAPALGGGRFSAVVTRGGLDTAVDFDLSELDADASVADVAAYMNGRLEEAGALTRVSVALVPASQKTTTAGGKTFSLGEAPAQLALKLSGGAAEAVSFAPDAAQASPAAYVVQTADTGAGPQLALSKFDTASAGSAALFTRALPAGVTAVRASAAGPDGSVYVLADVSGTTADGQVVKGAGDMALLRYDSAGALAYTRTLGAASAASGTALSVSPDGKRVAVAGVLAGALDGSSPKGAGADDGVVAVFDAAEGVESWTVRAGGAGADRPAALAWGADGALYVAGRTDDGLPGAAAVGGTDAAVQGFSPSGRRVFAAVYGTAGTDAASALVTTPDGALVVAGVENGRAVLRRFDPPLADGAAAGAVRDLGDLGGGAVTGLGLAADGSLRIAGTAGSGLALPGAAAPPAEGRAVFTAALSADLLPSTADAGAWWSPPAARDPVLAAAAVVQGGSVYVTGSGASSATGAAAGDRVGFAAALDPASGQAGWSRTLLSQDGKDAPAALAVASTGVSVLDRLGLPSGAVPFTFAADLVSNTTLRPGDSFRIGVGSAAPVAFTITAGETLADLAKRIGEATGGRAAATVTTVDGYARLKIAPVSGATTLRLAAGPAGADALAALGLQPTLLTTAKSTAKAPTAAPYAVGLTGDYALSDADAAKSAFAALSTAVSAVRKAYADMTAPPPTPGRTGGKAPAYLTAQIAQYKDALARLTGSG